MNETLYKAPETELAHDNEVEGRVFYVVSVKKFTLLFIATLSLYSVYWFYKSWSLYKHHYNKRMVPALRGIFSIFFAHSLFRKVNRELANKGQDFDWHPMLDASVFVLLSLATAVIENLPAEGTTGGYAALASLVLSVLLILPLIRPQQAINVSQGDPEGAMNNTLTAANYVWMGAGVFIWVMSLMGTAMLFGWISYQS